MIVHFIRAAFEPVGYVGSVGCSSGSPCNAAWRWFNRVDDSDDECQDFDGPSMSVGDFIVVTGPGVCEVHEVLSVGFGRRDDLMWKEESKTLSSWQGAV